MAEKTTPALSAEEKKKVDEILSDLRTIRDEVAEHTLAEDRAKVRRLDSIHRFEAAEYELRTLLGVFKGG